MTSPMLLGPLPSVSMAEVSAAVPPPATAEAVASDPAELLQIDWSLTHGQEQPPESATNPPEEEEETSDPNEIVVEGEYGPPANDSLGAINQTSFEVTQRIDSVLVEPAANVYRDVLPDPLRDGLGNFVRNLREPSNFLNYLLQFKIGDAFETLGRFAINSTIGIGGLIDVAGSDAIGLPYRQNGFANTMGYYGIGNGTYLYLPITGPTTLRDLIGNTLDQALVPTIVGRPYTSPEYAIPLFVVANLDSRLEIDEELERIGETVDPYATRRDVYLWRRERDIALLKGQEPPPRPDIVIEIEDGVEALYEDDLDETDSTDDTSEAEASDTPQDSPQISYSETIESPSLGAAVAITQPRTR